MSYISFFSFIAYLFFGAYVLYLDRGSRLNRIFAYLCGCLAVKSIFSIFVYNAQSEAAALYWYKFGFLGWSAFPPAILMFFIALTNSERFIRSLWVRNLIFAPWIYYLYKIFTCELDRNINFSLKTTGVYEVAKFNLFGSFDIYFTLYPLVCIYLLFKWHSARRSSREKKLSTTLLISAVLTLLTCFTTDVILPAMELNHFPLMAHNLILIWLLGVWQAVNKYKFMTITPAVASGEIFSKISDILILTSMDGRILKVNNAFTDFTGFSESEVLSKPIDEIVEGFSIPKTIESIKKHESFSNDFKITGENKTVIPVKVLLSEIKDEWRDAVGYLICCYDQRLTMRLENEIKERKDAQDELQKARDALDIKVRERTSELALANKELKNEIIERKKMESELIKMSKFESLGILAGGIAHDFNNFLTGIVCNISLAKNNAHNKEHLLEVLTRAESVAFKARDLTFQFLTFSKGGKPIKKTADMAEILMNSATFTLKGSNVNSKLNIAEGLWKIKADEGQINQVMTNILINAMQAMPEGGTIEINAENCRLETGVISGLAQGDFVRISIKDQGYGIPAEHKDKIFDPYFTTKSAGNGLGLTSAYSIIKNHDGALTFDSSSNNGTIFYIHIPAELAAASEEDKKPEPAVYRDRKIKVLLMDDEKFILDTLGELLEEIGITVECASEGMGAIEKYLNAKRLGEPFDVLIIDLTVPGGMGGVEMMHKLSAMNENIRAIASSGYFNGPVASNFRDFGFSAFLAKPYEIEVLKSTIYEVLETSQPV